METRHVRYFLAICDELNFTRAAKKCGIAQPSLTNAIQRMEREIGGALFLRSRRAQHVQLTTLGLQLFPICVQMNELIEKARSLVST
jgi:DNA-binding transcriptional LysR family regulator